MDRRAVRPDSRDHRPVPAMGRTRSVLLRAGSDFKPDLIVHPEPTGDGGYAFTYDFALAPARTPATA